jgi:hypothetical protein
LKFLAANLELTDTPLKVAMRRMRSAPRQTGMPDVEIGMAWRIYAKFGGDILLAQRRHPRLPLLRRFRSGEKGGRDSSVQHVY